MNLFDPTGRMQARRERQYASLRDMFRSNGIDSVEAAEEALKRMRNTMFTFGAVLVAIPLVVLLFSPDAAKMTAFFALLVLAWLVGTLFNARRHVRRYIAEELEGGGAQESASA